MKKVLLLLLILISIFGLTGCSSNEKKEQKVIKANLNEDGNILINKEEVTNEVTFISYETDEVTIGLLAVKASDGTIRIAFNTCQSCNPSPNAYFIQEGEYLVCQNCGTKFHIDEVGKQKGGCNPAPVQEIIEADNTLIMKAEYINTYKEKFENWNGPKIDV